MISLSVPEYYHVWGEATSPEVNGSSTSTEGGEINYLQYHSSFDYLLFTKDSGGISANSVSNYGGWDDLILEIDLRLGRFWETTDVTITILYSFTPVVPVE